MKVFEYVLLTIFFGSITIAALLTLSPYWVRIVSLVIFAAFFLYYCFKLMKSIGSTKGRKR